MQKFKLQTTLDGFEILKFKLIKTGVFHVFYLPGYSFLPVLVDELRLYKMA